MSELHERPTSPPPPVRTRKPWLLIGAGCVVAVIFILVIANLDRGAAQPEGRSRIGGVIDLAAPEALTEAEQQSRGLGSGAQPMVRGESGAWVEVADPATGRLAQRYNADRIDPLPDDWTRMEQFRASFHPENGRIITMSSDSALAHTPTRSDPMGRHAPRRSLESGTLEGHVVIRMYQPSPEGVVDLANDEPALTVLAEKAQFDNVAGEVRCDETVEVVTGALRYKGRGLTMTLAEGNDTLQQVVVDEAIDPIRIDLARLAADRRTPADGAGATEGGSASREPGSASSAAPGVSGPAAVAGATPAPAPMGSAAPTPVAPAEFFRLTLHDDVVITRYRDRSISTMRGDTLSLVFSLDNDDLGDALAGDWSIPGALRLANGARSNAILLPAPWTTQLASLSVATIDDPARVAVASGAEDIIEIEYSGRMELFPVERGEPVPASTDDVWLELVGAPITFEDPSSGTVGQCAAVTYRSLSRTIGLAGSSDAPFRVSSDRFTFRGERLWIARGTGLGRIEGPGDMTINEAPAALVDPLGRLELALASRDEGVLMLVASIVARQNAAPSTSLEITWSDGVDLEFEPQSSGNQTDDGGLLRAARFQGDVRVRSDDFAMRSMALDVEFDPTAPAGAGNREAAIRLINATGGVVVNRLAESGMLSSETLRVIMTSLDGKAIPVEMEATGHVEAQDVEQSVWADRLKVTFQPRLDDADAGGGATRGDEAAVGNVEVKQVDATTDVRVLLKDGTRVFADRLGGDAIQRTLNIGGQDVMIVNGRFVADRMTDLRINEAKGQAHSDGPGRFLYFNEPVAMPASGRADRPVLAGTPAMRGSWTRAMAFDDRANEGGGSLDLRGEVSLRAEPEARRLDTLEGDSITFDLVRTTGAGRGAGTGGAPLPFPTKSTGASGSTGDDSGSSGGESTDAPESDRAIARVTARGGALAESKTWADASRTGDPVLFKVAGEHLEYDTITREALVVGDGQLLVHDVAQDARAATAAVSHSSFGAKGTSNFSWKERMDMRREVDDRYLITMSEAVEILHQGVKPDDTLTLTADRVEATVLRPEQGAATEDPGSTADAPAPGGAIELGGPAKLLRVKAIGRVLVRTSEQVIECHEFDYNVDTGLATLRGRDGRKVSVQLMATGSVLMADAVTWDLRTGAIQISGAGGTVGR